MNPENKLPEDFKKKWVAALRSGEYKQGTALMCSPKDNLYCCLGVAGLVCDLSPDVMRGKSYFGSKYTWHLIAPPGLPEILQDCTEKGSVGNKLAEMNDEGKTFSEIADYIEVNL